MACAIEDAGFEIRDCIAWHYGQGFPENHNVSNKIDRCSCHKSTVKHPHDALSENVRGLRREVDADHAVSGGTESDVRAVLHGDPDGPEAVGGGQASIGTAGHGAGGMRDLPGGSVPPEGVAEAERKSVLQPVVPRQVNGGPHAEDRAIRCGGVTIPKAMVRRRKMMR